MALPFLCSVPCSLSGPRRLARTFCTIRQDPRADAVLSPMGEIFGRARHWSFKQIHVLGRPVAEVKKEAQAQFGITARHFNGIRFDLDQAVAGWSGTMQYRIQQLKDAIDGTIVRIAVLGRQMEKAKAEKRRASLKFKQVGKKQRLDRLRGKLAIAEREFAAGQPRIYFGGHGLLQNMGIDKALSHEG
jgi:hypothetical protein